MEDVIVDSSSRGRSEDAAPAPTWKCEYCGRFYSERTAAAHGYCQQAQDRRDAESVWRDV